MYLPPDDTDPPELPILCAILMRANDGSGDGMSDAEEAPLRAHLREKLRGWTPGPEWRARYDNGVREMALGVAEYIGLDVDPTPNERGAVVAWLVAAAECEEREMDRANHDLDFQSARWSREAYLQAAAAFKAGDHLKGKS